MSLVAGGFPRPARGFHGAWIAAIKQINDALIWREIGTFGTIDKEANGCGIGVIIGRRQKDRLLFPGSVFRRTMRQKAVISVCPKQHIKRFETFLRSGLDDGAPAAVERLLKQARQHSLQGMMFEMIE